MPNNEPNPAAEAVKTRLGNSKAKRAACQLAIAISKAGCVHESWYEYEFHHSRAWRFDLCYPSVKLAIEMQGSSWAAGRHHRGAGSQGDYEKMLAAAMNNWLVLPLTYEMAKDETVANTLAELIERREFLASQIEGEW